MLRGYEIALSKTLELIETTACWTIDAEGMKSEVEVAKAVKTAISAKQFGLENKLAKLLAEAVTQVTRFDGGKIFQLDNIRVSKIPGGALEKSFVVDGMVGAGNQYYWPRILLADGSVLR